jgi:hypothetical protein
MDRNILRKIIITETYKFENDDWWKPNGSKVLLKSYIESYEWLRYFKKLNSL